MKTHKNLDGQIMGEYWRRRKMREQIINALKSHARGHIEKHKVNVENLIQNNVGVAEHPDLLESVEKELKIIADYDDQLSMLDKYF